MNISYTQLLIRLKEYTWLNRLFGLRKAKIWWLFDTSLIANSFQSIHTDNSLEEDLELYLWR
jgi:hypothetical protein